MPSQELRDRMNAWAQQHDIGCKCAACGAMQWQTGEIVTAPVADSSASVRMVQIFCSRCGYTMSFKADVIGLEVESRRV